VRKCRDLTGDRYGMLTVLGFHSDAKGYKKWLCLCDCGKECIKYGHQIRAGTVVSCGCYHRKQASELGKKRVHDLTGRVFGRLVVLSRAGSNRFQKPTWLCRCGCGKEKILVGNSLLTGNSQSCGCIQKETMRKIRWNLNLTAEERATSRNREMAISGLHLWREDVFKRDGYGCVVCGNHKSGVLVAHHKESWNRNKDLRLNVNNGDTVCTECHKEFHSRYGYGDNTKAQWEEFITTRKRKKK